MKIIMIINYVTHKQNLILSFLSFLKNIQITRTIVCILMIPKPRIGIALYTQRVTTFYIMGLLCSKGEEYKK